jgi:hypothetical protein
LHRFLQKDSRQGAKTLSSETVVFLRAFASLREINPSLVAALPRCVSVVNIIAL